MPCELHQGVLDADGNKNPVPAHIYVDDALVADPGLERIKKALVACIEAIFVVLGKPDTRVRQVSTCNGQVDWDVDFPWEIHAGSSVEH